MSVIGLDLDILRIKSENRKLSKVQIANMTGCTVKHVARVINGNEKQHLIDSCLESLQIKSIRTGKNQFAIMGHALLKLEWSLHVLQIRNKLKLRQVGNIEEGYYMVVTLP